MLATDFGTGPYAGIMKCVIAGITPAPIVDLTHQISPQDIAEGFLFLRGAMPYLPQDCVLAAVVDPGVGTARRAICVVTHRFLAVGPDNGLLSFIPPEKRLNVFEITSPKYTLPDPSPVFHGRDIFAPAAAHLANGLVPGELGPKLAGMTELGWLAPQPAPDGMKGVVIAVDRFGNLITNIEGAAAPANATVTLESTRLGPIRRTYADVEEDTALALTGSSGFLEIAVRNGSAAKKFRAGKGAVVFVRNPK